VLLARLPKVLPAAREKQGVLGKKDILKSKEGSTRGQDTQNEKMEGHTNKGMWAKLGEKNHQKNIK